MQTIGYPAPNYPYPSDSDEAEEWEEECRRTQRNFKRGMERAAEAADAAPAALVATLDEWEACKTKATAEQSVIVLQLGSPACTKCPPFTTRIDALKQRYNFTHVYANTHACEEDLLAELEVAQLPAYKVVRNGQVWQAQGATPDQVTGVIESVCPPVLVLDEDF